MKRRQKKRIAIKVARQAAREYLGCRVGTFLRKLDAGDADAQMAFYAAAEDVGVEAEMDFDIEVIMQLLELILEFIEALQELFDK